MQTITRERLRSFDKNKPVDCRTWLSFVILEDTIRYHRIRYTEFDETAASGVECQRTPEKDRHNL
jgi:hypothetical protein